MTEENASTAPANPIRQTGEVSLWFGRNVGLDVRVKLTSGGLLAIAGLVSSILLSTAVLVAVSLRESNR